MSFTDFITDHGRRVNKESFIHLVQVAQADGSIDSKELEMLHRYGKRFSLSDPEIDTLIKTEKSHIYSPPYELEKRFEHLYDIVQIMMADGLITIQEKALFYKLAIAASFRDEEIPWLLEVLSEGIEEGKDEEELLAKFRKSNNHRSR